MFLSKLVQAFSRDDMHGAFLPTQSFEYELLVIQSLYNSLFNTVSSSVTPKFSSSSFDRLT